MLRNGRAAELMIRQLFINALALVLLLLIVLTIARMSAAAGLTEFLFHEV